MKNAAIVVHLVNAIVLGFLFYWGPPMGESELHPWDVLTLSSSMIVIVLCPIIYLCLWKNRRWPKFTLAATKGLLYFSLIGTLAETVLFFQWPHRLSDFIWRACVYLISTMS